MSSDISEILVTEREFSSIGKVGWYVGLDELLPDRGCLSRQPSTVTMIRVPRWWIRRPRHSHSIGSRQGPEVIVEAVILFDDDHHAIDFAGPWSTRRLLHRNHVRFERARKNLFYACSIAMSKSRRIVLCM